MSRGVEEAYTCSTSGSRPPPLEIGVGIGAKVEQSLREQKTDRGTPKRTDGGRGVDRRFSEMFRAGGGGRGDVRNDDSGR